VSNRLRVTLSSLAFLVLGLGSAGAESTSLMKDDPIGREITGSIGLVPAAPPAAVEQAPAKPASAFVKERFPPGEFVLAANTAVFSPEPFARGKHDPRMAKLQVLLDRAGVSPGVIDGFFGGNVSKAIAAAQRIKGLTEDGVLSAELWRALERDPEDAFVVYEIAEEDVAGPFVAQMPTDYAEMALLPGLYYRNPVELLAERFHMDEEFLRALNPDIDFDRPGSTIVVANTGSNVKTKVARLVADKAKRQLLGYDAEDNLVVAYPATIGSSDLPSPSGVHAVKNTAVSPEYWYRPQVNFQQGNNTKALRLPPGPNNPVGAVWIGLDKPTYGIHGTPEPSKIDKTNSHGCIRLANFDVLELVKLVEKGVPVEFTGDRLDMTAVDQPSELNEVRTVAE
jgi:lipoprotein-anchoring transpeptidase ErfK/SrfK